MSPFLYGDVVSYPISCVIPRCFLAILKPKQSQDARVAIVLEGVVSQWHNFSGFTKLEIFQDDGFVGIGELCL